MSVIVGYIDGDRVTFDSDDIIECEHGVILVPMDDNREFYLAYDSDTAGRVAREYWEDMAENDSDEFTAMVGSDTLVKWGLNQPAGPGSAQVRSLQEWLDLTTDFPEEHLASYDGEQRDFKCNHPDFSEYTVAYRHN